jgi:hypothetical protein
MTITITTTETSAATTFNALILGESGVGKTKLAETLHEAGHRVLVLATERGTLSLGRNPIHKVDIGIEYRKDENGEFVRDEAGRMIGDPINPITHLIEVKDWLISGKAPYDWIFLDSLNELGSRMLVWMKTLYPDRKDSFPMWDEYAAEMRALIKAFVDCTFYHFVMTCIPKVGQDNEGRRYYHPGISGKDLARDLPSWFDEVFAMRILAGQDGGQARWLVTQPHEEWPGKDRSGTLQLFEQPNLAQIAAKVMRQAA